MLKGETVLYASADSIRATLDYAFMQEKNFSYKDLNINDAITHIAKFISGVWQIHAFGEGNIRTTVVFTIKYLCTDKGDIIAMDRAYIDYSKLEELTGQGVTYVTKMKKRMCYVLWEDIMWQNPKGQMEVRIQHVTFIKVK